MSMRFRESQGPEDETHRTAGGDIAGRNTIDLTDDGEIRERNKKLGLTERDVQASVEKVGPIVEDARRYLSKG